MDTLHQLEIFWILFIQGLGEWLAVLLNAVSQLGTEDFYMLIMPSLYWCIDAGLGFRVGTMLLLSNGVNTFLKLAFHSPRPYWFDARVKAISAEASFGLPSGHAQHAASIWGLLAASVRTTWVRIGLVVLIFLIGFSRLYLGVHFISDVIVGWAIGGLMLWAFLRIERPIGAWLRSKSLRQMLVLALVSSLLLGGMILLSASALGSWKLPELWETNALAAAPENDIDPLNIDGAFTIAGTWFGLMAGVAWLFHRQGGFNAAGTPQQRLLRYVIGLVGIFFLWFVLGKVFPRNADWISFSLRFARYALVGLWVSALAPLLFERLGLAGQQKEISSLSSSKNPL